MPERGHGTETSKQVREDPEESSANQDADYRHKAVRKRQYQQRPGEREYAHGNANEVQDSEPL